MGRLLPPYKWMTTNFRSRYLPSTSTRSPLLAPLVAKWIPPPGCKFLITEGNPSLTLIPMICTTHFFKLVICNSTSNIEYNIILPLLTTYDKHKRQQYASELSHR